MSSADIRFNVVGYVDRRGRRELEAARAMEQARADRELEEYWRERVARNRKEIARVTGGAGVPLKTSPLLKRQAT
jgi:hypothetical protein